MTKHTPGPWTVSSRTGDVVTQTGRVVHELALFSDEAHADNHLIAAAPEMKDALIDCIQELEKASGRVFILPGVIENACAALRKARGEE